MSPSDSAGAGTAALANLLLHLATLRRAVDALEPGAARVRAAVAVHRAHRRLGRLLGARLGRSWAEVALEPVERAVAALRSASVVPAFDAGQLLCAELRQGLDLDPSAEAALELRSEWLSAGVGLGGRVGFLFGVMRELATRPELAAETASRVPPPYRAEAERLAASGIARLASGDVFVGRVDEASVDRFEPSLALLTACARQGVLGALERVLRRCGSPVPGRARLEVVAWYAAAQSDFALARLARLTAKERDRAASELARLEIARQRTRHAEQFARSIANPGLRAQLMAEVLHAEALELVVRRELRQVLPQVSPIERAVLSAEIAVVHAGGWRLDCALDELAKLLPRAAQSTPWAVMAPQGARPCVWARALRCAVALALSGDWGPSTLRFPRRLLPALLRGTFMRRELGSVLPLTDSAVHALIAALPGRYARLAPLLHALHVERRAQRCAARLDALRVDAGLWQALARPESRAQAVLAGALLEPGVAQVSRSATDPLRAAYDFGIAIAPAARRKRRVLLQAARATLQALAAPLDAELLQLRIALLRQLQGASVPALAQQLLEGRALPTPVKTAVLDMLAQRQPELASRLVWTRFAALTDSGRAALEVLGLLERRHDAERGATKAWLELERACGGTGAAEFVTQFASTWRARVARTPNRRLLAACADALRRGDLPTDGQRAAQLITDGLRRWLEHGPRSLFTRGSPRDVEWLILAAEPDPARAWTALRWQKFVERLDTELGAVDDGLVRRLAATLRLEASSVVQAWQRGAAPNAALGAPLPLSSGLELHYLDKCRDFLAFLRFADCVPCCFASDGTHHEAGMKTSRWILRLYKDPLSFCFHVRRREEHEPVGFVFGGFALTPEPALILNGVYLKRQQRSLRFRILEAIEHGLARPLGVSAMGVGNLHGGYGALPKEYALEAWRAVRLRALRARDGGLETTVYDDMSYAVNRPQSLRLHWKRLSARASAGPT